ncbi:MAG: GEVED domain-containing protein [Euryarchaeota archaeon]|nr:GEVED domain-containing protein [Euryarchaeota archaeon]
MGKTKKLSYRSRILSMFVVAFVVSAVAMIGTAAADRYPDWGDAPDPTYPTLNTSNGANHESSCYYLGVNLDGEVNGQPDSTATGDDTNGSGSDDEDGVTFTSVLTPGSTATVDVTAHVPSGCNGGNLSAWIDFNADGDWSDTDEQIFTDMQLTAGLNTLMFDVPSNATTGATFARFRFCNDSGMCSSYTGPASNGEVEDYMVNIEDPGIPEFSSIAIPVAAILGLMFFFNYRKRRRD